VSRATVTWVHLLPELHTALATWPEEDPAGQRLATDLRDRIAAKVRETIEDCGELGASEVLGIGRQTIIRWRRTGGPLA
jgi:hypothetical protein